MKEIKNKIKDSIFGDFNQELIGDKVKLQNKVNKLQRMIDMINYLQPIEEKEDFVLPYKWCIKNGNQDVVDFFNRYGINKGIYTASELSNNYAHFPSVLERYTTNKYKQKGYTEITFEQFKKYVLNK